MARKRPRLQHRCNSVSEAREWIETADAGCYKIVTYKEEIFVESFGAKLNAINARRQRD